MHMMTMNPKQRSRVSNKDQKERNLSKKKLNKIRRKKRRR